MLQKKEAGQEKKTKNKKQNPEQIVSVSQIKLLKTVNIRINVNIN